jgi:hypothetical protein
MHKEKLSIIPTGNTSDGHEVVFDYKDDYNHLNTTIPIAHFIEVVAHIFRSLPASEREKSLQRLNEALEA